MAKRPRSDARDPGLAPAVPAGVRIYAIGDIHGRADLLDAIGRLIADDMRSRSGPECRTILLGDYVDRGPASAAVIDRLARSAFPTAITALRGNHDDIFADFLRGAVQAATYVAFGGDTTLSSYGIDVRNFVEASETEQSLWLRAEIPAYHHAFLAGLPLSTSVGDYFFCHAGARPGVALDAQAAEDLLWIREDFLHSRFDFGRVVVHGHTPFPEPFVRSNAIGIDTHAYETGVLTALVLEGNGRRFLQTP